MFLALHRSANRNKASDFRLIQAFESGLSSKQKRNLRAFRPCFYLHERCKIPLIPCHWPEPARPYSSSVTDAKIQGEKVLIFHTDRKAWLQPKSFLCVWLIPMHTHSSTDTDIQCPRCQQLASSRCLKTGATSVSAFPSSPLPLATVVGESLAMKGERSLPLSSFVPTSKTQNSFNQNASALASWSNQTTWSISLCRCLEDLFSHLKMNSNPQIDFPFLFKSLHCSSLILPTSTREKWAPISLSLYSIDNPPVVFSGPLCGCCSLATASLSLPPSTASPSLYLHTPDSSIPQLSPHTWIIQPLTSVASSKSYHYHSFTAFTLDAPVPHH